MRLAVVRLACLLSLGCSFQPVDQQPADGAPIAAGPDAATAEQADAAAAACAVTTTGVPSLSAQLASATGGTARAPRVCPAGQFAIAAAFDLTNGTIANHGGEQVIDGVVVQCGTMTVTASAATLLRGESLAEIAADSANCSSYVPSTRSPETTCPPGAVWVGLSVHRPDDELFNQVELRCAPLQADGRVGGPVSAVPVPATGTSSRAAQEVDCPAGSAVVGLTARTGCGIDGLQLHCQPLICASPGA